MLVDRLIINYFVPLSFSFFSLSLTLCWFISPLEGWALFHCPFTQMYMVRRMNWASNELAEWQWMSVNAKVSPFILVYLLFSFFGHLLFHCSGGRVGDTQNTHSIDSLYALLISDLFVDKRLKCHWVKRLVLACDYPLYMRDLRMGVCIRCFVYYFLRLSNSYSTIQYTCYSSLFLSFFFVRPFSRAHHKSTSTKINGKRKKEIECVSMYAYHVRMYLYARESVSKSINGNDSLYFWSYWMFIGLILRRMDISWQQN